MLIIIYDKMNKLILHIPHLSTNIPFLDGYVDDENKIVNFLSIRIVFKLL